MSIGLRILFPAEWNLRCITCGYLIVNELLSLAPAWLTPNGHGGLDPHHATKPCSDAPARPEPVSTTPANPPPCPGHKLIQHRDGKPPWCRHCKRLANGQHKDSILPYWDTLSGDDPANERRVEDVDLPALPKVTLPCGCEVYLGQPDFARVCEAHRLAVPKDETP